MSKQPLTMNDISIIRSRNQDPCLIFNKGPILVSHSSVPFRIKKARFVGDWDMGEGWVGLGQKIKQNFWARVSGLTTGNGSLRGRF